MANGEFIAKEMSAISCNVLHDWARGTKASQRGFLCGEFRRLFPLAASDLIGVWMFGCTKRWRRGGCRKRVVMGRRETGGPSGSHHSPNQGQRKVLKFLKACFSEDISFLEGNGINLDNWIDRSRVNGLSSVECIFRLIALKELFFLLRKKELHSM